MKKILPFIATLALSSPAFATAAPSQEYVDIKAENAYDEAVNGPKQASTQQGFEEAELAIRRIDGVTEAQVQEGIAALDADLDEAPETK